MSSKSRPCTAAHSFIAIKCVAGFCIRATSEFAEKRTKKTKQCADNTDSTLKFVESLGLIMFDCLVQHGAASAPARHF
jgi:hypothetical protein